MSVYSTYVPGEPLADFVESLWFYESTTPLPHVRERRLPSGSVELVINLREDVVSVYDCQAPQLSRGRDQWTVFNLLRPQ